MVNPIAGQVFTMVKVAVFGTTGWGIVADVFVQLREETDAVSEDSTEAVGK